MATAIASRLQAKSTMASLTVNDLSRSIAFYEGLGFAIAERWEQEGKLVGVHLKAGAAEIGLSQDDWAKGRDRVKAVGLRIWINTDQDVDALAAAATTAGVRIDEGPVDSPWGSRMFAVTDPDGFKLSISRDSTA